MRLLVALCLLFGSCCALYAQDAPPAEAPPNAATVDETYVIRARELIQQGKFTEACQELTALWEKTPDDPKLRYLLGLCQFEKLSWLMGGLAAERTAASGYSNQARRWRDWIATVRSDLLAETKPDDAADGSQAQEIAWEEVEAQNWYRLSHRIAVSPDNRYIAWVTVTPKTKQRVVHAIDLTTGGETLSRPVRDVAYSINFLDGPDGVLVVNCGSRSGGTLYVFSAGQGACIAEARVEGGPLTGSSFPGQMLRALRTAPGTHYMVSATARDLITVDFPFSSLAQALEWAKNPRQPDKAVGHVSLKYRGQQWTTGYDETGVWDVEWSPPLLVTADGKVVLVPVQRTLPNRAMAVAWMWIDISDPQKPLVKGLARDWLSALDRDPVYGDDVLKPGTARVLPASVPLYAGGSILLRTTADGGVDVTEPATGKVCVTWTRQQVASNQIVTAYCPSPVGGLGTPPSQAGGGGGSTTTTRTIRVYR